MNKTELVAAIAAKAGLNKDQASKALNAFEDAVTDELKAGGSVALVGFGTFSVKAREARTGRNPKTGETLEISASNVPAFKAGKGLKEAIN
ncbi:HU family DNA-binding protein [Acinetobacter sp. CFCC 10889]|uniref:HU family DNA-binding protein n=1 Tax=Acinetobacter sp. CFCC 10889 TaxID=1775557 RepID=UPI000DCF7BC2|nr:HU family DNA-binding protein [Acinetobacter sp. CFCC 10889]